MLERKVSSADTEHEHSEMVISRVVEQRVSNLTQGLLTLVTMTGPLLVVLRQIPQAVLAGLFWIMGFTALAGNGITAKITFLCRERSLGSASDALKKCGLRSIYVFVGLEILGFGATLGVTETIGMHNTGLSLMT